jgi:hypothetical protein
MAPRRLVKPRLDARTLSADRARTPSGVGLPQVEAGCRSAGDADLTSLRGIAPIDVLSVAELRARLAAV